MGSLPQAVVLHWYADESSVCNALWHYSICLQANKEEGSTEDVRLLRAYKRLRDGNTKRRERGKRKKEGEREAKIKKERNRKIERTTLYCE